MADAVVDVAAGVILRADGKLLLGQRPEGKPWSGWWELPGGKVEPGETVAEALARELEEEIGIRVRAARPWVTYVHRYPEKTVRLSFCLVTQWDNEPRGLESQALAWVDVDEAHAVGPLLPATLPVLRWLGLPTRYGITSIGRPDALPDFILRLQAALAKGLKLVQLREPGWPEGPAAASLHEAMATILDTCHAAGARLLVNSVHPKAWAAQADGWHLRAADAMALPPETARAGLGDAALIGVSAHHAEDIAQARRAGADFVVLGPVLPTASHPGQPGMGWPAFTRTLADAGLPAYAIGGQVADSLADAWAAGAHGIAGIRAFI